MIVFFYKKNIFYLHMKKVFFLHKKRIFFLCRKKMFFLHKKKVRYSLLLASNSPLIRRYCREFPLLSRYFAANLR